MGGLAGTIQGFKGLLGPSLPKRKTMITLVIGVLLGLLWAYAAAPVVYYDADPSQLRQGFQDEWVKLLADRQAATNADLTEHIAQMLLWVDDPLGIVNRLMNTPSEAENQAKLQDIVPAAELAQPNAADAPQPNLLGTLLPFILAPIVILIVFVVLALLWNLLIYPFVEPTLRRMGIGRQAGGKGTMSSEQAATEIRAIKEAKEALAKSKSDFSTTSYGPPLMQKMSIYALGRGQFDDSFEIEDENEKFLGECGAGVSETIGVGDPQKLTAAEVWLFDKDDFVRTVTKVFASKHAFEDPALRAKLEEKGELVLVEPGAVTVLETSSLRLQARIVDVVYGTGPLPPNSYFEKLTIELAAWRKDPGSAPERVELERQPAGTYQPPAPNPVPSAPPSFNPAPPAPPAQQAPAQPSPFAPPAPQQPQRAPFAPPPPPPRRPEDDPFGGTGDFTPIS